MPTLPLPSVSLIKALLANQYTYLVSLDLPTILAFSLPSTLLPANPLPLPALGVRGPGNQQKHLEYIVGSG